MIESMPSVPSSSLDVRRAVKPTLAAVARAAQVSLATASYALRGESKIPSGTRKRICAIAKQIGYTPNPELGRLMFLLRERQHPQTKATLAFLTLKGRMPAPTEFGRGMLQGMRERAGALGFALDVLEVDPAQMGSARVTQILRSRGVKGVILAPLAQATNCADLLDWNEFSGVSATCLVRAPNLARVIPHHFQIAELALTKIWEAGHRRVLWVTRTTSESGECAVDLAAHGLAQRGYDLTLIPWQVPTRPERLSAGARQHRADAILVPDSRLADDIGQAALRESGACGPIFALSCEASARWAGVHQNPATLGNLTVETLARLIQSGERGPSACAAVTMIEGTWVEPAAALFGPRERLDLSVPSARAS